MDYVLIKGLPILVITLIIVLVNNLKRKFNSNDEVVFNSDETIPNVSDAFLIERFQDVGITIPIERLPETTQIDAKNLFEITDRTIISRISHAFPVATNIATNAIANATIKNAKAALESTRKALEKTEVYKVIIPSGATLAKSKEMEGAARGIYHGAKGVKGHANLVKANLTDISKANTIADGTTNVMNVASNVMNVASLVVGQYYMSEINSKIEAVGKNVSKISDFQKREFKSRILSLIARVGEISNFSSEILENDDLRNRKLQTLDDLKGEGTQLLQQVNLDIDETINKNQKPAYDEYQESVDNFSVLIEYQQILMSVLEEISKLTYLLGKGESSSKMCFSVFNTYLEQSNKIRVVLEEWHQKQIELLGIDIDKNRRSKTGIGKIVTAIPGFIDDNWNYKQLANDLGQKINAQKTSNQLMLSKPEDVYDKDVQIIIKDGKYYYLAGEIHEHR